MTHPDSPIGRQSFKDIIAAQLELWDVQHSVRGTIGFEGGPFRDVPNSSAVIFGTLLPPPPGTILETGSANGRDARYWAKLGYMVHCVDFSKVALNQLAAIALEQEVHENILPILHDVSTGTLPPHTDGVWYDGFYSRSALHIDDQTLHCFTTALDTHLLPGATIMIEGKTADDPKVKRSISAGNGLAVDMQEGGHLRRVWTPECMEALADMHGWQVHAIERNAITTGPRPSVFLRLTAKKI